MKIGNFKLPLPLLIAVLLDKVSALKAPEVPGRSPQRKRPSKRLHS